MTDKKICWLQISSGRGPVECQLAVQKLVERILKEAKTSDVDVQVIEHQPGDKKRTALSCLLSLSGDHSEHFSDEWTGTILWICKSPYRKNHKRKNWFISVESLQPTENSQFKLKQTDVSFQTLRASGPGGQHVNTTESAVRATHTPSGISVVASEERSQHMNKKLALARIRQKLSNLKEDADASQKHTQWAQHDSLQRGDASRVFQGEQFTEIKS